MTGKDYTGRWFVALMDNGMPVEILDWATWTAVKTEDRDCHGHLVLAKDHMDAYLKATRGDVQT